MSSIRSRSQLQAMIAKAQDTATAQVYQHLDQFTVIVACSGDALLLLLQPLADIVNLYAAWKSLVAAWPYQLTSRPYLTKSNPPSLCAKFEPPFIIKRKPGPPKTSELVSVHLQITPEMFNDLRAVSRKDGRSVNECIRAAISTWLDERP